MTNATQFLTCGFAGCGEYENGTEAHSPCDPYGCLCNGKRNTILCHEFAAEFGPSFVGAPLDHPAFQGDEQPSTCECQGERVDCLCLAKAAA